MIHNLNDMIKKDLFDSGVVELSGARNSKFEITANTIKGVSICTQGEAKTHGIHIESEFLQSLVEAGNLAKQGIKARFGHPGFFSDGIGTFIGTFANFRLSDDGTKALADLALSPVAKKSPQGNLYDYVLEMANSHPAHFGTSIVNNNPKFYQYNQDGVRREVNSYSEYDATNKLYMSLGSFDACDIVDMPAANAGLFSQTNYKQMNNKFSKLLSKLFLAETEPSPKPEPIKLQPGTPEVGQSIILRDPQDHESLIPDGEFLITSGDHADKLLIVKAGQITEIREPVTEKETESLSLSALQKLPQVAQLQATITRLQSQLEKEPAGYATTVIAPSNEFSRKTTKAGAFHEEAGNIAKKYQ